MIKFQKKPILVLTSEPVYIRREANGKHNEVTVMVAHYAIPLNHIFCQGSHALNPNSVRVAFEAAGGFQGIEFGFNKNLQAPAFTFTVRVKTERRGDDTPNQEWADKIVMAKANSKACVIAERILSAIIKYYKKEVSALAAQEKADGAGSRRSQGREKPARSSTGVYLQTK